MSDRPRRTTQHHPPTHAPVGIRGVMGGTGAVLGVVGLALTLLVVAAGYAVGRWGDGAAAVDQVRGVLRALSMGEASGADDEAEMAPTIALGDEGTTGDFTVVVRGIECTDRLSDVRRNPASRTSPDAPAHLDVEAAEGQQFCVVSSSWTNSSQQPELPWWSALEEVRTAAGRTYAPSRDDRDHGRRLTEQAGHGGDLLNPRDTAELRHVFTLPADEVVTHALMEPLGFEGPAISFAVR